jgi:outer membrane protein
MLRRTIVAVAVCVCFGFSLLISDVSQAAELKLAVMDVQKVLVNSAAGKAAKAKFDTKMKELQGTFKGEEEALIAMQKNIEKKSSAWSEETKQAKIRAFQKKRREAQEKAEDARFELKGLQDKELAPILKALEKVVANYGDTNGYTAILDSKSGVVFFAKGVDISDKLIVELDAAMAQK